MNNRNKGKRKDNVLRALALQAEGCTLEQIAKELGLSYSYVQQLVTDPDGIKDEARKNSYRRPCPLCGTLMSGSNGPKRTPKMCATCSKKKQQENKKWTREAIIAAIQLFAERNGRPPVAHDFAVSKEIRGDDYPALSNIYSHNGKSLRGAERYFSSWAEAIEAAGFPKPRVGHKAFPRGQGVTRMAKEWVVFLKEDDNTWSSYEVEAVSSQNAIDRVAFREGEYFAIGKNSLLIREVEPKTIYQVIPATPGGDD